MRGVSTVIQEYTFVLGGDFLRTDTRSVFKPQEENPKGEVHEDFGIFSYDGGREKFVLRGFCVEGFVNRYVGEVSVELDLPNPCVARSSRARGISLNSLIRNERICSSESLPKRAIREECRHCGRRLTTCEKGRE